MMQNSWYGSVPKKIDSNLSRSNWVMQANAELIFNNF